MNCPKTSASDRPIASRYLDPARRRLGTAAWRSAWRRGQAMGVDSAMRLALHVERRAVPMADPMSERKPAVIRAASKYNAPAPDIKQMNAEIEQGYVEDDSIP
jgi:hypothetical protein